MKKYIESVLARLHDYLIGFEMSLIPRQLFVFNYEILNREFIVFDLGRFFMRPSHANLVEHFLREIHHFGGHPETINKRNKVIRFLEQTLATAKAEQKPITWVGNTSRPQRR